MDQHCSTRMDVWARHGGGSASPAFPEELPIAQKDGRGMPKRDSRITAPWVHPVPQHWCNSMASSELSSGAPVLPSLEVSPPYLAISSLAISQDGAMQVSNNSRRPRLQPKPTWDQGACGAMTLCTHNALQHHTELYIPASEPSHLLAPPEGYLTNRTGKEQNIPQLIAK